MDTILPERRTGARWVAATGAFLLAAAAAVFVGVRWHELPDGVRFGIVVAFTGGCLVAGRRLRGTLPATGDALFHLGAILVPVDVAALNVRLHLGWRPFVLVEGLVITGVLGAMALATGSVVLRRVAVAGGVVLACGVAALTPVPAPLLVAGLAAGALLARQDEAALLWGATAGLAPALSAALAGVTVGAGTFVELGVTGDGRVLSVVTGAVAAGVLGRLAVRRGDMALAVTAVLAVVVGVADGWFSTDRSEDADMTALASAFALVELAGLAIRRDPFWRKPVGWVVDGVEAVTALFTAWLLVAVAVAPLVLSFDSTGSATEGFTLLVVTAGWGLAAVRRWPSVRAFPVMSACISGSAAALLGTGDALLAGSAMAGAAAVALVASARRPALAWFGAALGLWGVVVGSRNGGLSVVLGVCAAVALTVGAARLERRVPAAAGVACLAVGLLAQPDIAPATSFAVTISGAWALAVIADLVGTRTTAKVTSWSMVAVVAYAGWLDPSDMVAGLVVAAVACAIEAVRTGDDRFAYAAAVVVQLAVVAIAVSAGLNAGEPGVALCVSAIVWSGLAVVADGTRWREPLVAATALGSAIGLGIATADLWSLATSAMIVGGLALSVAVVVRSSTLGHAGGIALVAGTAGHLGLAGVGVSEAYLAPIALHLLVAGVLAHRQGGRSSWTTLTLPVVVLGGAAVAERIAGGPGWHAVVAGAVGIVAVATGAWGRLAGPLLAGTALLVVVTGYESLGVATTVPTWGWLAIGGASLLATGVALERNDASPVEAGRRLVDVVAERFE